jgi:hypothetical protein
LFDWPSIPDPIANGLVGFGDGAYRAITLGIGNLQDVRDVAGITGGVDICSTAYKVGRVAGAIDGAGALGGALGAKSFVEGGWLNANRYLRIGLGRKGGDQVFRLGGQWLENVTGQAKIDLFNLGPL